MKVARVILITALFIGLTGCAYNQKMDGDGMVRSYTQISQEEAMEITAAGM